MLRKKRNKEIRESTGRREADLSEYANTINGLRTECDRLRLEAEIKEKSLAKWEKAFEEKQTLLDNLKYERNQLAKKYKELAAELDGSTDQLAMARAELTNNKGRTCL